MKFKIKMLVLAIVSVTAMADDRSGYWGLNWLKADVTVDGAFDTDKSGEPTAWFFNIGGDVNKYVSLEGRLGKGLSDGSVPESNWMYGANMEIETIRGIYAKFHIVINDTFRPYVILGQTKADANLKFKCSGCDPYSYSESDTSMGFGFDFYTDGASRFNIEKLTYLDKDGVEVKGLSLGYARHF